LTRLGTLGVGVLVGLGALYLSRTLWLPAIGGFLIVADPLTPAEVVLPLAGDLERIYYAAKLHQAGYAERVLLTNLPLDTQAARDAHLRRAHAIAASVGVPEARIRVVPGFAETTFEEARRVRAHLERLEVRSLLVVTSPWHTRRARMNLRAAFRGSGIRLSVQPVPPDALPPGELHPYRTRTWWRARSTRLTTLDEYLKLAAYAVGIR
jgi:uncharacterized SAM-binding protein YcdF (DUF218 family)